MISIFLVVSFMAIQESGRIFTLVFPYTADLLIDILLPYGKGNTFFLTILIVNGIWILAYFIRILILYFSLKGIRESFHENQFPIHSVELQFLLIPGLTSLCINI